LGEEPSFGGFIECKTKNKNFESEIYIDLQKVNKTKFPTLSASLSVETKFNPETPPLDQINDTKMERAERDKKSKQKIVTVL